MTATTRTDKLLEMEPTPKELLASRLIDVWTAERGTIPWDTALRLSVIVGAMTQDEMDKLNELYKD